MSAAKCYVCGSRELANDADLRSPTCEECKPARDHVVSMQTGEGGASRAVCQCGWTSTVGGARRHMIQQTKVRMHWRDSIRRVMREYDAEFGAGSAMKELLIGPILLLSCGASAVLLAVGWGIAS